MTNTGTDGTINSRPLRLWPGVAIVVMQWLAWLAAPSVLPGSAGVLVAVLGGLIGGLMVAAWWLFFSRAPGVERWGAALLVILTLAVTPRLLHQSVAEGNMGFQFFLYAGPLLSLFFVAGALAARRLAAGPRRAAMAVAILLGCGTLTLVRSKGITGDGAAEFTWRWSETAEQRLLAQARHEPPLPAPSPAASETRDEPDLAAEVSPSPPPPPDPVPATTLPPGPDPAAGTEPAAPAPGLEAADGAEWPGFRGANRDGVIPGVRIQSDWSTSPPVELWRRPIGPGVSSFAVHGDRLYTQEQRGDDEVVACYDVTTGEPLWRHRDVVRFWDAHVGAGPRATPALSGGRLYALGATGVLNALDARTGALVWSRDVASDQGAKPPTWGFVSSPLVVDDIVVVHVGRLAAYELATGEVRWIGTDRVGSYSSPHLLTLGGVAQILLLTHAGVTSVAPADGSLLWEHAWPGIGIVQPALATESDLLISMVDGSAAPIGTRRLSVAQRDGGWSVEERWTSNSLKPSFSPIVVHQGYAFGFDGRILACIDAETGERKWKGGRYGSGQLVLLPDQDLLLVVSERGELALVEAVPGRFTELARFSAIEGKTWNQPVLVGDVLLVRNGEEMAAFRLSLAGD
jgi:outer membrane protein assembly factor BamB